MNVDIFYLIFLGKIKKSVEMLHTGMDTALTYKTNQVKLTFGDVKMSNSFEERWIAIKTAVGNVNIYSGQV